MSNLYEKVWAVIYGDDGSLRKIFSTYEKALEFVRIDSQGMMFQIDEWEVE